MDFNLDTKAAASYGSGSKFIADSGKYIGRFYRAEDRISTQGTQGVDLLFRTDAGETADYITLWHTKADGTRLSGFDAINALLTVLRLRGAKKAPHRCEKWNKDTKQYEPATTDGYPDLLNKPVGIVLQATLEDDGKGGERQGKQIIGFFEASTELTAQEILSKATRPEALTKQLAWLAGHPVKDNRKNKATRAASHSPTGAGDGPDFDDDIPFDCGN